MVGLARFNEILMAEQLTQSADYAAGIICDLAIAGGMRFSQSFDGRYIVDELSPDVPINRDDFNTYAITNNTGPHIATRVWGDITTPWKRHHRALARYQSAPPNGKWLVKVESFPSWRNDLCIDAHTVSLRGLVDVVDAGLQEELHGPASKLSTAFTSGLVKTLRPRLTETADLDPR